MIFNLIVNLYYYCLDFFVLVVVVFSIESSPLNHLHQQCPVGIIAGIVRMNKAIPPPGVTHHACILHHDKLYCIKCGMRSTCTLFGVQWSDSFPTGKGDFCGHCPVSRGSLSNICRLVRALTLIVMSRLPLSHCPRQWKLRKN